MDLEECSHGCVYVVDLAFDRVIYCNRMLATSDIDNFGTVGSGWCGEAKLSIMYLLVEKFTEFLSIECSTHDYDFQGDHFIRSSLALYILSGIPSLLDAFEICE